MSGGGVEGDIQPATIPGRDQKLGVDAAEGLCVGIFNQICHGVGPPENAAKGNCREPAAVRQQFVTEMRGRGRFFSAVMVRVRVPGTRDLQ